MSTFDDVLGAAQDLPPTDRIRLVQVLWETVPPDEWPLPSKEWIDEVQQRSAELDAGRMSASPWPEVRLALDERPGWMSELRVASVAERDFTEALCWYAERGQRAAEAFNAEFDKALAVIGDDPLRFPLCDDRHRFYLMDRYPYQVIFRIDSGAITVIAVAHAKRKPWYWADR